MVARTPTVCHYPAATLATTDLRVELEHHRSGEDGSTTIERQRERHHNLDSDYDTPKAAQATHFPYSLGARDGCMAMAPHL
jgi:hypothetical protein